MEKIPSLKSKILFSQEGQSMVETLIVLPLILFFILIIMEVAMLYNARQIANYAAFCAARTASVYGVRTKEDTLRMRCSAAIALSCITPTITGEASQILQILGLESDFLEGLRHLAKSEFLQWPLRFADAYLRTRIDKAEVGDGPPGSGRNNVKVELTYYYKCQVFPMGILVGDGGFSDFLNILKTQYPSLSQIIEGIRRYIKYNIKIRASAKMDYWFQEG